MGARAHNKGVNVMHVSTPAAWTSPIALMRTALEGQNGSKVRRTSSSSVVTVIFTWESGP